MTSKAESQPLTETDPEPACYMVHIKALARTAGLLTCIVMWASSVVTIRDDKSRGDGYRDESLGYMCWYLVAASVMVTFLEITWIINKSTCCVKEGCCCRVWSAIMWIDNWRKFFVYLCLSVPLFLEGLDMPLGIISGFLLIIVATLYMAKTFRISATSVTSRPEKQHVIYKTPHVTTVTTEVSTQTDRENFVIDTSAVTSQGAGDGQAGSKEKAADPVVEGALGQRVISSLSLSRQQPKRKSEQEVLDGRAGQAKDTNKYDFETSYTEPRGGGNK